MGDQTKTYEVLIEWDPEATTTVRFWKTVHAGSVSFTVSGDLVFEDEARNFQESYARGYWLAIREVKKSN